VRSSAVSARVARLTSCRRSFSLGTGSSPIRPPESKMLWIGRLRGARTGDAARALSSVQRLRNLTRAIWPSKIGAARLEIGRSSARRRSTPHNEPLQTDEPWSSPSRASPPSTLRASPYA